MFVHLHKKIPQTNTHTQVTPLAYLLTKHQMLSKSFSRLTTTNKPIIIDTNCLRKKYGTSLIGPSKRIRRNNIRISNQERLCFFSKRAQITLIILLNQTTLLRGRACGIFFCETEGLMDLLLLCFKRNNLIQVGAAPPTSIDFV